MGHPKTSRFRNLRIGWLIAILAVLAILLCGALLLYPSFHARYLFSELETLQLGRSSFEDAERLARKIHAQPYPPNEPCNRSKCEWVKRIDNAYLPLWWRGTGEGFSVAFDVKDSLVVRKNTGFGIGLLGSIHPSQVELEEQEHWGPVPIPEPVKTGWQITEKFRYYLFIVYMTPKASVEDRRRYTAFNYSCFWKYQGCKDARELLPTADPFPSEQDEWESSRGTNQQ
ncbi:MAG TPA: hypothetical protein VG267_16595 [Terracidiphilus sp.]|jgi:hypothetical protein|nr:hypothetical protein [Terracidiphilus sp.]